MCTNRLLVHFGYPLLPLPLCEAVSASASNRILGAGSGLDFVSAIEILGGWMQRFQVRFEACLNASVMMSFAISRSISCNFLMQSWRLPWADRVLREVVTIASEPRV